MLLLFTAENPSNEILTFRETFVPHAFESALNAKGIIIANSDESQKSLTKNEIKKAFGYFKSYHVILLEENYNDQIPQFLVSFAKFLNATTPKIFDRFWKNYQKRNAHRLNANEYARLWDLPQPKSETPIIKRHFIAARSLNAWNRILCDTKIDSFYRSADRHIGDIVRLIKKTDISELEDFREDVARIIMMCRTPPFTEESRSYNYKSKDHQYLEKQLLEVASEYLKNPYNDDKKLHNMIRRALFSDWGFQDYMLRLISEHEKVLILRTSGEKIWPQISRILEASINPIYRMLE